MSLKMHDVSLEQVNKLVAEQEMFPLFTGQNPYIASGPQNEILIVQMPNGLYMVELLDKKQMEESLQITIKAFNEYAEGTKS